MISYINLEFYRLLKGWGKVCLMMILYYRVYCINTCENCIEKGYHRTQVCDVSMITIYYIAINISGFFSRLLMDFL